MPLCQKNYMATFVNNVPVNSNYLNDLIDPVIYLSLIHI